MDETILSLSPSIPPPLSLSPSLFPVLRTSLCSRQATHQDSSAGMAALSLNAGDFGGQVSIFLYLLAVSRISATLPVATENVDFCAHNE